MLLSIFGFLVDPTDQYLSDLHRSFSHGFVWIITNIVGILTPLSFLGIGICLLGQFIPLPQVFSRISEYRVLTGFLVIFACVEIAWFFYCLKLKQRFGVQTSFLGMSQKDRVLYLDKVLEHCKDPLSALVRWYYTNSPESVGVECMEEWLSWAFFSKNFQHLTSNEVEELGSLTRKVVSKFPEIGRPSAAQVIYQLKFMRLHFDEMVYQHKPLIAYVVISIMQLGGSKYMEWVGFKHHTLSGSPLSYWTYRPANSSPVTTQPDPEERPIFLVHGIGIGVTMYINVIKTILAKDPTRPVFILELPYISLKIVQSVPNMHDTIAAIDEIFLRHKINHRSCSWLAHSYGSIVTAWVLKERPEYFNRVCFVDPVCFALWEPDLIYNFLYRIPTAPIHRVCQFFVAQDLLVSYTLFRNFWWLQNVLFPEDIPCPTSVFLSSHDFIINANSTYTYLQRRLQLEEEDGKKDKVNREFKIVKMNGLSHGNFLNSPKHASQIVECL